MSTFNLDNLPAAQEAPEPKSPTTAFLLSLALPGAGHFYIGETQRGLWTLLFFFIGAGLGGALLLGFDLGTRTDLLGGVGIRTAAILYAFALVDAYFTAAEINRGEGKWVPENPRVAATLNLLTNGFGYFYLGERTKGLIVFFIGGAITRGLRSGPAGPVWVDVAIEVIVAGLALDAWRIGARIRRDNLVVAGQSIRTNGGEGAISPIVPQTLAGAVALGYASLVFLTSRLPQLPAPDRADARMTVLSEGVRYRSAPFGVAMTLPPSWEMTGPNDGALWSFETGPDSAGYCFGMLFVEALILRNADNYGASLESDFAASGRPASIRHRGSFAGLPGGALTVPATDNYLPMWIWYAERESIFYTLTAGGEQSCAAEAKGMADTIEIFDRSRQ